MSRSRALGPLLAASLALAACNFGLGAPTPPGATPADGTTSTSIASKVLAETADALIIEESFPGTGKAWLRLPFRTLQLQLDKGYQLKARVLVRSAADAPELTWTSSDPAVVSVSQGQLVGKKLGSATITVEGGGERASLTVLVVTEVKLTAGAIAGGTGTGGGVAEPGTAIVAVETLPGELVYGREGAYAVNFGGTQFQVVGGSDGTQRLNTKEWAPYLADLASGGKHLGDFILDKDAFIANLREGLVAVGAAGRIYLIGGDSEGSVERSGVVAAGDTYEVTSSRLDTPRRYMAKLTTPDWVLLFGGEGPDGGALASVEYATRNDEVEEDGEAIGDFATVSGASLLTARSGPGAALAGSFVYVFGGGGPDDAPLASVERAPLQSGGVGAFESVPTRQLVTARKYFSTVQTGSHVYVLGGLDAAGAALDSIERAAISEDGQLGTFEVVGFLANARYKAAAALLENEIAIAGGRTDAGVTRDVEVLPTGGLLPGATRPTPRPSASPTAAPTASPTAAPTAAPTATPTPTPTPTASPTASPTATPTASPTPTATPT